MNLKVVAAFVVAGCRAPEVVQEAPPDSFPTPWEAASAIDETVSGQFRAVVSGETPGAGWFRTESREAHDLVQAAVRDVGATWPVVQVRIGGREPGGWRILELDVALNHWVAGEIPVDGTAAIGQLTAPNGSVQYVVGGVLDVTAAGIEAGQQVEGTFRNLTLAEVAP